MEERAMATQRTTHSLDEGRITFGDSGEASPKDPVCQMQVNPDDGSTKRVDRDGRTYFFCSEECRDSFASDPEKFLSN
jgi:YHS domain-containing protein